jgi:hypothetical protein
MALIGRIIKKGGSGSGNYGHEGRPGLVGGSATAEADNPDDYMATKGNETLHVGTRVARKNTIGSGYSFGTVTQVNGVGRGKLTWDGSYSDVEYDLNLGFGINLMVHRDYASVPAKIEPIKAPEPVKSTPAVASSAITYNPKSAAYKVVTKAEAPGNYWLMPDGTVVIGPYGHEDAAKALIDDNKGKIQARGELYEGMFNHGAIRVLIENNIVNIETAVMSTKVLRELQALVDKDKLTIGNKTVWWNDIGSQSYANGSAIEFLDAKRVVGFGNMVMFKQLNGYIIKKGGEGSGNYGHVGRPGKRGGSGGTALRQASMLGKKKPSLQDLNQESADANEKLDNTGNSAYMPLEGGGWAKRVNYQGIGGYAANNPKHIEAGKIALSDALNVAFDKIPDDVAEKFVKGIYSLEDAKKALRKKTGRIIKKGGEGSGNFNHQGRPGMVGGSAPEGTSTQDISPETFGAKYDPSMDDEHIKLYGGMVGSKVYGYIENGDVLRAATNDLSEQTGIGYYSIKAVRHVAAFQPFMSSYAGSHVVESVSRVFDQPMSEYEKNKLIDMAKAAKKVKKRDINNDYKANGASYDDRPLQDEDMDKLVKAVYNNTQAILKKSGIDYVKVYRGDDSGENDNVLTHWSTNADVAKGFGKVRTAIIPVERIFSIPSTGFGVSTQFEVIVLKRAPRSA